MDSVSFFSIGFGGQGQAWFPSLQEAGLNCSLVLREDGPSFQKAIKAGFSPISVEKFEGALKNKSICLMLIPDRSIGAFYEKHLAPRTDLELHIVLATGFADWSGELKPRPGHFVHMLGPKAIGPELRRAIVEQKPTHNLKAAVTEHSLKESFFQKVLSALGYAQSNLIPCTFEQEAVGDLISEQLLLCGGIFTLYEQTVTAMKAAGIPDALIQEECGTELVLIAKMIAEKGLDKTREAISDTAKQGARITCDALLKSDLPRVLQARVQAIRSKNFVKEML